MFCYRYHRPLLNKCQTDSKLLQGTAILYNSGHETGKTVRKVLDINGYHCNSTPEVYAPPILTVKGGGSIVQQMIHRYLTELGSAC